MKRILLTIALLFLAPSTFEGATYYISNSGSDAAAGTSTGTAWATVAQVNGSTFAAGDQILFQRGGVWREQLTIPNSGGTGNRITIGAYGSGAAPVITGANLITSWASNAPTNLAPSPNAFNAWNKTNVTVTGGYQGPAGTGSNAFALLPAVANNAKEIINPGGNVTIGAGVTHTFEVYVKAAAFTNIQLQLTYWSSGGFISNAVGTFNASTGVVNYNDGGVTATIGAADANAFRRTSITVTSPAAAVGVSLIIKPLDGAGSDTFANTSGDIHSYLYGAAFYQGTLASNPLVYYASLATAPGAVYVDDAGGTASSLPLTQVASAAAVNTTANSWFWDDPTDRLYVRLVEARDPGARTVEASIRDHGIYSDLKDNLTVQDFTVRGTKASGVRFVNGSNITAQRLTVRNWLGNGILFEAVTETGVLVEANTVGRCDLTNADVSYGEAGINVRGTTNATISNNAIATIESKAIWGDNLFSTARTVTGVVISYNVIGSNDSNIQVNYLLNALITRNIIRNSRGLGIGVNASDGTVITYNTIQNLALGDGGGNFNGIDSNGASLNGKSYHNVIRDVYGNSHTLEGGSNGWNVRNNIFDQRGALAIAGHNLWFIDNGTNAPTTLGDNLYFSNPIAPTMIGRFQNFTDRNASEWATLTGDADSIYNQNPNFTNATAGVFTIPRSSPAVNAGAVISGVNDGYQGSAPDIGIYETLPYALCKWGATPACLN